MRNVLVISRYFPPRFDIGGKRVHRFARYLPAHGWRPIVVTDRLPPESRSDPSAGLPLPDPVRVVRSYYPPGWPAAGGGESDGSIARPTSAGRWAWNPLLRHLRAEIGLPLGRDLLLVPWAWWVARRLAATERIDAVMATSSPYSALVFGAVASRVARAPLLLDLRDPWSLNFLQRRKPAWVRRVEAGLERSLLRAADRVTFTCESAVDAYRRRYPELPPDRFTWVYNGFDPEQRPAEPVRSERFRLVHFGNCYGDRRLGTVLRALAFLRDSGVIDVKSVELLNLGRLDEDDVGLATELGLDGVLDGRTFVPYEEGLAILAGADLELLVAYGRETLYVPAKLYDYLLAGRPVLCLSPPSELTRLVEATGAGSSVDPEDVAGAAAAIRKAWHARSGGKKTASRDPDAVQRLSAPAAARRLASILDGISVP